MVQSQGELKFKFKYVNSQGAATGFFSQKAILSESKIILGKDELRYVDVMDTSTRDRRLVLAISDQINLVDKKLLNYLLEGRILILEIYHADAITVEKFIDRISSRHQVELKRQAMIAAGQGHLFHATTCPECQATIDLSNLNRSSYVYCRFCESIFPENLPAITNGSKYRICDECHMFDRVQGYTEFYFYFLLVVYGFYAKRRHLCDNCAHQVFIKAFLINFIFILGIPSALWIKIKSLSNRDPALKSLSKATGLSKKGNYAKADPIYNQLHKTYPEHPGLLMNEGLGHLFGGDGNGATNCFNRSLRACPNYSPVLRLFQEFQNRTTRPPK
ncbi:MAG TPA: hypothetical protein IGS52_03555 [Oscillatoriaceae cyanobacterium M33_DOE_052]|uniref:Tetratricopeptide repeat protein n=1 Tax=Planktothricoides sp. SpSt-374 TaxID=2282167 RepID=A0A7C3ZMW3_9CYAN|nr:hypothetical protein [Oscillatoriaceae cyanobacterium M33_DOE_052]